MATFYVYRTGRDLKPRYKGFIKAPDGGAAMKLAVKRWPGVVLDLIDKRYIADKKLRTIKPTPWVDTTKTKKTKEKKS